jgi:hypothetical protein
MVEIVRTANLGGRACYREAGAVKKAFDQRHRPESPSDPKKVSPGGSIFPDRDSEEARLIVVMEAFDQWLADRLGGPQARGGTPTRWFQRFTKERMERQRRPPSADLHPGPVHHDADPESGSDELEDLGDQTTR